MPLCSNVITIRIAGGINLVLKRLYSKMETQETGNWMESGSTKFNKLNCKWKLKWKLEWKLKWKLKEKGPPFGKKKIHVTFFLK